MVACYVILLLTYAYFIHVVLFDNIKMSIDFYDILMTYM